MLKIETTKGETKVAACGSFVEVMADLTTCVHALRNSLKEQDSDMLRLFDRYMNGPFVEAVIDGPEAIEKAAKEADPFTEMEKAVNDLKQMIEKITGGDDDE